MVKTTDFMLYRLEEVSDTTIEAFDRTYEVPAGWFTLLESGHKKRGLEFIIPLKHPSYLDEVQDRLLDLEAEETIQLQLSAVNKQGTAWKVLDYEEDYTPEL